MKPPSPPSRRSRTKVASPSSGSVKNSRVSVSWSFLAPGQSRSRMRTHSARSPCLIGLISILRYLCSRLTPAFSGAVNGNKRNHENCAARPPLQRLVMRRCGSPQLIMGSLPPLKYCSLDTRSLWLRQSHSLGLLVQTQPLFPASPSFQHRLEGEDMPFQSVG